MGSSSEGGSQVPRFGTVTWVPPAEMKTTGKRVPALAGRSEMPVKTSRGRSQESSGSSGGHAWGHPCGGHWAQDGC